MKWYPYTFTGALNEKVLVRVREVDATLNPTMSLRRPDGSPLTGCTGLSSYDFTKECTLDVSSPGTYTIWVYSLYGDESGAFTLYVTRMSSPTTPPATSIFYGQIAPGNVAPMRWYPFTLSGISGEIVSVTGYKTSGAGNLDLSMSLRRPDGSLLCTATSSAQFTKVCTLDASGDHTIWIFAAGGDQTGTYGLYYSTPLYVPAAYWEDVAGKYSYKEDSCSTQKDPVTMIYRNSGSAIAQHVSHHGSTNEDDPTDPALRVNAGDHQYYFQVSQCTEGMVRQANKGTNTGLGGIPPFQLNSRWHVRCDINGAVLDPSGGTFAACTPHYDQATNCGHSVPPVFGNIWPGLSPAGSGFDAGRDYLYYLLVTVGQHQFLGSQWWGNDDVMVQCDQVTYSGSDGYVNEIGD